MAFDLFNDVQQGLQSMSSWGSSKTPVLAPASGIQKGMTRQTFNPAQVNKRSGFGFLPGQDPALGGGGGMDPSIAGFNTPGAIPGMGGAGADWLSMDGIFGYKGTDGVAHNGWGGTALAGAQAIGDMYSSMKQFGLAEDQFEEGKRQYNQNYQAQVKNYNADIEDRQRARVASNSGGYQSVADYMDKNRQV